MIVLFPHCGFLSETSRMLAIARALVAQGASVTLATRGGPYRRFLEESGLPLVDLEPRLDAPGVERFLAALLSMGQPGAAPMLSVAEIRAAVASEAALLRDVGARAAVIGFTLTAFLSSRVAGIPLVTSHGGSFVPPVFERRLAPAPVTPPPGAEKAPEALLRFAANLAPPWVRAPVRELNLVARELGVEGVPSLAALMLGDLTLVTDVPEVLGVPRAELEAWRPRTGLFYRRSTRLRYVGPLFAELDLPIPAEVEDFLADPSPKVYVSLSSSSAAHVRAVVERVREAGARVLVTRTVHDLDDLASPGVLVTGVLPNHRVVPRVDVAVTMGGQGTVQTAMVSGTPLVGFPLQPEQELNVALAERLGMAIRLAPRQGGTPRTTEAVRGILAELPRYRAAARRAQEHYRGQDGPAACAQAILARANA